MEHIAIQKSEWTFDDPERLTVLCRCKKRKDVPYGKVTSGDKVYILSDGLIKTSATVSDAISIEYNDIAEVRELCKGTNLFNGWRYWDDMRDRHYATVVRLTDQDVLPKPIRPKVRSYGSDWIVLDSEQKRRDWLALNT